MNRSGLVNGASSKLCLYIHRLSHYAWNAKFHKTGRMLQLLNRFLTGADIDCQAYLHQDIFVPHTVGLVVGETARVEKGVVLMPHVVLGAKAHVKKEVRHPWVKENAYIGAGAVLLGPIIIGEAAVVGANAVVVNDVSPDVTVVGIPARPVDIK